MQKLGYTEKQVGRMTFNKWRRLFDAYKKNWDNEMKLWKSSKTYEDIEKPVGIDDVIPF